MVEKGRGVAKGIRIVRKILGKKKNKEIKEANFDPCKKKKTGYTTKSMKTRAQATQT
jgi:hypothetical protein